MRTNLWEPLLKRGQGSVGLGPPTVLVVLPPHPLSNLARTLVPNPKPLGSTPWGPSPFWESGDVGCELLSYSLAWCTH